MKRPSLLRSAGFRFALAYLTLFAASVLLLLGFIYWSTVRVIERQTEDTIEAEIRGLAEQYRSRGLPRLSEVLQERSGPQGDPASVYLLAGPDGVPLVGNLSQWPEEAADTPGWVEIALQSREGDELVPQTVRARTFRLSGGFRLLVGRNTQERGDFRNRVVESLAWSLAITLLLGLAGGLLLSQRLLSRVEDIADTAARIMRGDLSRRVPTSGSGDEFDRLSHRLNEMLERIEQLLIGMRLATDSLAHDLRGPLTRLKSRIELALRNPPDESADRAALAGTLAEADAALHLFSGLLRIAEAESGMAAGMLKPLDLSAIARDAYELYAPLADESGIVLSCTCHEGVTVRGHGDLLAQAIANLLDNAVKYTPQDGSVRLEVLQAEDAVELSVADNGPGIPLAQRELVLQRFTRLDPARSTPGAGLGLSLVAAVAKLHGAELRLADNEPGLRVTMRLPIYRKESWT